MCLTETTDSIRNSLAKQSGSAPQGQEESRKDEDGEMKGLRAVAMGIAAATYLASAAASAHTTIICWNNEADGSTTFYAGNYHGIQEPEGGIAIDGASYPFTAATVMQPPAITACQPLACGSWASPNAYQIVNVPYVSPEVHEVDVICDGDNSCGWPGCYPMLMDFTPPCADADGDYACDDADNCPAIFNDYQSDADADGMGDECDACPFDPANDDDLDGVCGASDNCPGAANPDQADADGDWAGDACDACALDADNDEDGDGVCGDVDVCAGTTLPEDVPTVRLGVNRFADVDGDGIFDTVKSCGKGPKRSYTIADTGGCSCEQIIEAMNLGNGHRKFGCSIGVMDNWVDSVNP